MAVGVVERLEVVDIHHQQRQRLLETIGPHHILLEDVIKVATVLQAGQRIPGVQLQQLQVNGLKVMGALLYPLFQHGVGFLLDAQ